MMLYSNRFAGRWILTLLAGLGLGLLVLPHIAAADSQEKQVLKGFTLPFGNKPTALGFEGPGFVKTVNVKEGQHVKVGQILMTQDSSKEEFDLQGMRLDASDVAVKAAEAEYESQEANFSIIENAYKNNGAGNEAEYAKATADKKESALQIIKEKQDQKIKQAKVAKQEQIIKDMKLVSPVDGYVQTVESHVGENVDPSKPVLTIVQNDPLIVQMEMRTEMAQKLEIGRTMNVSYDQQKWMSAKVTFKQPMANTGGGTQTVHLELANPEGRDSGQFIYMELPADLTATPVAADTNGQSPTVTAGVK
jgi:multidrug efflux system membrane fusion protein